MSEREARTLAQAEEILRDVEGAVITHRHNDSLTQYGKQEVERLAAALRGTPGAEARTLAEQHHDLKTDSAVFQAVRDGRKTFEIRFNDRDFREGDQLVLRETRFTGAEMKAGAPLEYTGETEIRYVSHVLRGPIYGLAEGWAILSLAALRGTAPADEVRTLERQMVRGHHYVLRRDWEDGYWIAECEPGWLPQERALEMGGPHPSLSAAIRAAAREAPPEAPDTEVRTPTTEDEAALMILVGEAWLSEHAPQRWRAIEAPLAAPASPDVGERLEQMKMPENGDEFWRGWNSALVNALNAVNEARLTRTEDQG